MHMKRNVYKRPRSHRGKYHNIDMHQHHSRGVCHTHPRIHNALISIRNSIILRKQHAKATYTRA